MKLEQIYTGCLAQGAYYIESDGEAAIIDPLRETEPYISRAESDGARIKYIFETHFHADFVSGHLDLAKQTGATIIYGPNAKTDFEKHESTDGEEFRLGKLTFKVLHTPGHTLESTCYLLYDETGKEYAVFTGDTLFIGDVGRPDLAQKLGELTKEDLAGMLYDSLRSRLMPLPDDVLVYPAHGAGSACGKNMSDETSSTIGKQKQTNYALDKNMSRDEFIHTLTEGLLPPPQYFAKNAALNKGGYENIDTVMQRGDVALAPRIFEEVANAHDALILDVRTKEDFVKGFIPNSIFIGLDGSFAPWVGALVPDLMQAILIVAPKGREQETVKRLARVGYDNALGYLDGGFEAWKAADMEIDQIRTIDVPELERRIREGVVQAILDVRKPSEYALGHIVEAQNFALDFINKIMSEVSPANEYYLHCQSGFRSTVASSILRSRGFHKLINVHGKFEDIVASAIPKSTGTPIS